MLNEFKNWKWFAFDDIFIIKKGKRLTKEDITSGSIPFIGAIESNNGYREYIEQEKVHLANTITVVYNGSSVAQAFYQPKPFFASDDVNVLYPRFELNKYIAFFIITLIRKEKYRFNYGRKWESGRMRASKIQLPIDNNGKPDWNKIENFIKSLNIINKYNLEDIGNLKKPYLSNSEFKIDIKKWKYFKLSDLFIIKGSKTTPLSKLKEYGKGTYPYVTTQATNNGTHDFYNFKTESGNILTIDSAVLGYCSYQPLDFSASDHVEKLIPKFELNKYIATFLTVIINLEKYRYNYGRKCSQSRIKNSMIKLPAINDKPDFQFMENYIKSLPCSNSI